MKTVKSSLSGRSLLTGLAAIGILAIAPASSVSAQKVDPDPELFDGARTKKDQIKQDKKPQSDKWMEANLILYDSNEQGSEQGGQGRVGFEGPGFAEGVQGGTGMQAGIPLPMGGGGSGSPDQATIPGMIPTSQQSTPTASSGSSQSGNPGSPGGKPGEVAIGDPNQKIASTARPTPKVADGAPVPSSEDAQESKGEDTTTIPNAAAGAQSGKRGGGVEKGDAMPTDI